MPKFEFIESSTWFVEAGTFEEAMGLWQLYRESDEVTDEFELVEGYGQFLGEVDES